MSTTLKIELHNARSSLLDSARRGTLPPAKLRCAMTDLYENILNRLAHTAGISEHSGLALVAFGGLGRNEMLPFSDLDLILLHDGSRSDTEISTIADALWYPLWDAGIPLDHSVRTVSECRALMTHEPKVALSMLETRYIAGDSELVQRAVTEMRQAWMRTAPVLFEQLVTDTQSRRTIAGAIAHRAEPDLKNGAGGLRDAHVVAALAAAQLSDATLPAIPNAGGTSLAKARAFVLDVRTTLHVVAGRRCDVLYAQYADDVASLFGVADRFALAHDLSSASRTITFATDLAMRTARHALPRRGMAALRRPPARVPLAEGVVAHNGEVVLARNSRPDRDPGLLLRVAVAAARNQLPIGVGTLRRLAETIPLITVDNDPNVWDMLGDLLGTGECAVDVIETLDRAGLWSRVIPEWDSIRDLPSRSASHIYTVDRHLVQVAVEASALAPRTTRPDLLLLAALIHDIGKGRTEDHSELGAKLVEPIAQRLGMTVDDAARLQTLVRHHLLVARTITSHDPAEPATAQVVLDTLGGDRDLLTILALLTEADGRGTGPGAWTAWKAEMVAILLATADQCTPHQAQIAPLRAPWLPGDRTSGSDITAADVDAAPRIALQARMEMGRYDFAALISGGTPGLTGLCSVLDSRELSVIDFYAAALPVDPTVYQVQAIITTRFGEPSPVELIVQDIKSRGGRTPRTTRWSRNSVRRRQQQQRRVVAQPRVNIRRLDAPERVANVAAESVGYRVEVRAQERPGLLVDIVSVLNDAGWEIHAAQAHTKAGFVYDTFDVSAPVQQTGVDAACAELEAALYPVLPKPAEAQSDTDDSAHSG